MKGAVIKSVKLLLACSVVLAAEVYAGAIPEDSLRRSIDLYVDGWQQKSGELFVRPFAEGAQFVNIFGTHFSGKAVVASRHQKIFETFLKGTRLVVEKVTYTGVKDDLGLAHVVWQLSGLSSEHCLANPQENSLGCPRRGIFNHVFVAAADALGGWQIVETQNTLIVAPPGKPVH